MRMANQPYDQFHVPALRGMFDEAIAADPLSSSAYANKALFLFQVKTFFFLIRLLSSFCWSGRVRGVRGVRGYGRRGGTRFHGVLGCLCLASVRFFFSELDFATAKSYRFFPNG